MKNSLIAASVLSALLIAVMPVQAEKADRLQKVTIDAIEGDANHATGAYKLEKNVLITQGTMRVTADRGTVKTTPQETYNATLTGKPVCFRQRTDNGDWAQGVSDRVDYDSAKGLVELFGNAILYVGEDETRANYISYNTQTSVFEARESKERKATAGKGVSFVLQPRAAEETPAADGVPAVVPKKAPVVKTEKPPKLNEPAFSRCA